LLNVNLLKVSQNIVSYVNYY